jgi:hypothetical protein
MTEKGRDNAQALFNWSSLSASCWPHLPQVVLREVRQCFLAYIDWPEPSSALRKPNLTLHLLYSRLRLTMLARGLR